MEKPSLLVMGEEPELSIGNLDGRGCQVRAVIAVTLDLVDGSYQLCRIPSR